MTDDTIICPACGRDDTTSELAIVQIQDIAVVIQCMSCNAILLYTRKGKG